MSTVLRSARALAWLRWRMFLNAFRGTRRRDALERLSRAGSAIVPILLGLMMVPLFLGSCLLSLLGGWYLGQGVHVPEILLAVRVALAVATVLILFIPAIRTAAGPSTNMVRLTLLPVPRKVLHFADLLTGLADPWITLLIPAMVLFPLGILASGRLLTGLIALAAGTAVLLIFLALESTVSSLLALLYRDRRRGEIVTLVVLIGLSTTGFLPMLFSPHFNDRSREERAHGRAERSRATEPGTPSRDRGASGRDGAETAPAPGQADPAPPAREAPSAPSRETAPPAPRPEGADAVTFFRVFSFLPSEFYARAIVEPMRGRTGIGLLALLGVTGVASALYALSWTSYRRLLDSPESFSPKRRARSEPSLWRLPGLSPASSAVAQAQFRLVLRSVQGKMAMFFTPISVLFAGVVISKVGGRISLVGEGPSSPYGPLYAYAGAMFALLAPQRFLLNVFATDGAGLTLSLLSPISDNELVVGKSVGMGIVSAIPMLIITTIVMLISPAAPIALWAAVFVAAVSAYMVYAPSGALLSAIFPKAVNMNRMSSGSQPNGIATLIGLPMTALASGPPALVAVTTYMATGSPWAVLLAVLVYACIAALFSFLLVRGAARIVATRRENLALVAQGR